MPAREFARGKADGCRINAENPSFRVRFTKPVPVLACDHT